MKILYITAEGFDTPNPNNQMAEVMIRDFINNGHQVHLIQSRRKRVNPDIPSSLQGLKGFTSDIVERKVVDKKSFIKRYLNDVRYAFLSMQHWNKVKDADVIYLQSNPTILIHMLLLKLFKNLPIVYSIYDVFPGHAYDIGVVKSKFLYNILRIFQKPCYKLASEIIVLSEDMKKIVIEQGASAEHVHVVPAWYDVNTAQEIPKHKNRFIEKYSINQKKFYVQFAGTIGYVFNYKTVLELAKKLKDIPDIVIQIIGDGNVKEQFINEAEEEGLDNINFYPLQPVEMVADVYSSCDVCLIPLIKGVIGNGVPSKVPILMACRRVIISSVENDSSYAKLFNENDMGIAVEIDNVDDLAEAILQIYNSPDIANRMANNAFKFAKEFYSSTANVKKLIGVFEKVNRK
ncbi:glycosyltransferase family 4 protein [Neobacillus sp. LXY-4]|uniref:glycosyltransferase family 4 protein n=1 Tax=Neobacillus sp. LXY-4 TaxID=3379826 RepID=UPI003EE04562